MGRIYNNIKRIQEKNDEYANILIEKFIHLLTFEDTYFQKKLVYNHDKSIAFVIKESGKDLFIDCITFGIIINQKDEISIHS